RQLDPHDRGRARRHVARARDGRLLEPRPGRRVEPRPCAACRRPALPRHTSAGGRAEERSLMQKQAPTLGKLALIVVFALSCFLLLTYLWTSFGGPTPLSPKAYHFQADFNEAT